MKKSKIIIPSMLMVLACGSVIAGSTYALFTSESDVNIAVTSGKVDVKASVVNGASGLTLTHKKWDATTNAYVEETGLYAGEAILDETSQTLSISKMLPMDKISFQIQVVNSSNVTIQYRSIIKALEDDGLFEGLKITIGEAEFDGITAKTSYETWETQDTKTIDVTIEMPEDAENYYQNGSCKLSYSIEAVQGNANVGVYEVTPENVQSVLDSVKNESTIVLTEGDYDTLYLRQNLEVSTRRTDLDKDSSYPGYYREIKDLTIEVKEGATVSCDGIIAEAGLFWYSSAPASNQAEMNRATSGFISYLSLENIMIEGITFDNADQNAVLLRDNVATEVASSTLLVDGFTIKDCKAAGDITKTDYHFFYAGSGSNDLTFDGTNKCGYNNIALIGNEISTYYQPVCFNNTSAVLNGLKVKNNTFDGCDNNILQISNKINKGKFVFIGNKIKNINGRFIRMANTQSDAKLTFIDNEIITPIKYDVDAPEVVKITGVEGFKVYENSNNWNKGSYSYTIDETKYISNGDTSLLPDGTYSS